MKQAVKRTQELLSEERKRLTKEAEEVGKALENGFSFLEQAFGSGQEMLLFVTELTEHPFASQFISKFGCEKYFAHNRELMFYERQKQLSREIAGK